MRDSQKGQAMMEYTLCAVFLILALFTPFLEGKSAVEMLMEAIKANHSAKIYAIGHPVVGTAKGL
jgi:hypothetical protein